MLKGIILFYLQKVFLLNIIYVFFLVVELCVKIEVVKKNNEDGKRGVKVKVNFFFSKSLNKLYLLVIYCMNLKLIRREGGSVVKW